MLPQLSNIDCNQILNGLPGIIFFKNKEFQLAGCNSRFQKFSGFDKLNSFIGLDDYNLPWANHADSYRKADKRVMEEKVTLAFLESIRLFNGKDVIVLTRKSPIYDKDNRVAGLAGTIHIVSSPEFMHEFSGLTSADFEFRALNHSTNCYLVSGNFDHFNLSKGEVICLFYLVRGKTTKEIAVILHKSKRTIEKRIDSIKYKLRCTTKSEITCKAIEYGFIHFIPSQFIMNHLQTT